MRISDWSSDVCSSDLFVEDERFGLINPNPVMCHGERLFGEFTKRATAAAHDSPRRFKLCFKIWLIGPDSIAIGCFSDANRVALFQLEPRKHLLRQDNACRITYGYKIEERSEEHTSELQSLMRISYAAF